MKLRQPEAGGAPCTNSRTQSSQTKRISIDQIENRKDLNRPLDDKHVERLMDSIKRHGLRHAITVVAAGEKYEVIAGSHRFEAVKRLGQEYIDATQLDPSTTSAELTEISIAENCVRKDETLSAQLARIDRIMRARGCSFEEAARRSSIGKATTSKLKKAKLGLCEDAIALVDANPHKLGISIAYDVARYARSEAAQIEALESILDSTLTRDALVRTLKSGSPPTTKKIKLHLTLEGIAVHLGIPTSTGLDKLIAICGQLKALFLAEQKHNRLIHELPQHIGGKHVVST
ncbi:MAG: ParB/RepB/Spo0J family partition protein [Pirellulaceae bacterium]